MFRSFKPRRVVRPFLHRCSCRVAIRRDKRESEGGVAACRGDHTHAPGVSADAAHVDRDHMHLLVWSVAVLSVAVSARSSVVSCEGVVGFPWFSLVPWALFLSPHRPVKEYVGHRSIGSAKHAIIDIVDRVQNGATAREGWSR